MLTTLFHRTKLHSSGGSGISYAGRSSSSEVVEATAVAGGLTMARGRGASVFGRAVGFGSAASGNGGSVHRGGATGAEGTNGGDDDGDGAVDLADPGCRDADDPSEFNSETACDDGYDNDADGRKTCCSRLPSRPVPTT